MKLKILLLACLLESAWAQEVPQDDLCSKLPGHWQGIFTFNDPGDCNFYNGCTHLAIVEISYVTGANFYVTALTAIAPTKTFYFSCTAGVITSTVNPGNEIAATCNQNNQCFIVYKDNKINAELTNN